MTTISLSAGATIAHETALAAERELCAKLSPMRERLPLRVRSAYVRARGRTMYADLVDTGHGLQASGIRLTEEQWVSRLQDAVWEADTGLDYRSPLRDPEYRSRVILVLLAIRKLHHDARTLLRESAAEGMSGVIDALRVNGARCDAEGRALVASILGE